MLTLPDRAMKSTDIETEKTPEIPTQDDVEAAIKEVATAGREQQSGQFPEIPAAESDSVEDEDTRVPADSEISSLSHQELVDALTSAKEKISEMQDNFLRAKAEMENIRRRAQNEVVTARKYALEGFANEILLVNDSLDQAVQVTIDDDESEAVVNMNQGLALTLKQLETVLGKFSITEVEAGPGVKFDPDKHQAISMVASDEIESSHIINVMQKGFVLKDRLLRPAMVVVAS